MADNFRRQLDVFCGIGGVHCYCCNDFAKNGKKRILRRRVRHFLKVNEKREIRYYLNQYIEE